MDDPQRIHRRRWRTAGLAASAWLLLSLVLVVSSPQQSTAGPGPSGLPGDPIQLHPGPVTRYDAQLTPDGSHVVYVVDGDPRHRMSRSELYSVPIDGGPAVRLTGAAEEAGLYFITGDSSTVLYSENSTEGEVNLFAVPVGGGSPVDLEVEQPLNQSELDSRFQLTPDSSTVIYMTDAFVEDVLDLFAVPVTGGPSVKLNVGVDGPVHRVLVSPDSSTVVYRGSTEGSAGLFSGAISGGEQTRLTGEGLAPGFISREVMVSPDSARVVFMGSTTPGVKELFSVPIGGGVPVKLNSPLVTDGDVHEFVISPDASTVVYVADGDVNGQRDLYAVPLGGGEVVRLNAELVTGGPVLQPLVTPDSAWVVYLADTNPSRKKYRGELFTVPLDGSAPPTMLNDPVADRSDVGDSFVISPDGTLVVYGVTAPADTGEPHATFSVPVDRSDAPTKLLEGAVPPTLISSDSRRAILDRRLPNGAEEVLSVPIGGGTALTLSAAMATDSRVTLVGVSADSATVVYTADPAGDRVVNLFSVDIGYRCADQFATIVGTTGRDVLVGTVGPDVIHGLSGGDTIEGKGGADVICGGRGDDAINGGLGADVIYGNKGFDTIRGYKGADQIFGGKGKDTVFGGPGRDVINGGRRADTIRGGPGDDVLSGNRGDDELRGGPGTDTCDGNTGTNVVLSCEITVG